MLDLVKLAWSDARTRIIFPGLLLMAGSGVALLPPTGGRLVCDQGMCIQEHTAAFGAVREAILFSTDEIREFRIERGAEDGLARVVVELRSGSAPLTATFGRNLPDMARIVSEGSRFVSEGAAVRFVAAHEARHGFVPAALLLLLTGTGLAGWVFSRMSSDTSPRARR